MSDTLSSSRAPPSSLGKEAFDVLARLQARIDDLQAGSDAAGQIAEDLQAIVDEVRQALGDRPQE